MARKNNSTKPKVKKNLTKPTASKTGLQQAEKKKRTRHGNPNIAELGAATQFKPNDPVTGFKDEKINREGARLKPHRRREFESIIQQVFDEQVKVKDNDGKEIKTSELYFAVKRVLRDKNILGFMYLADQQFGKSKTASESGFGDANRNIQIPAELIAPDFLAVHRDIKAGNNNEYLLLGGRGSTKSSFTGLEIISLLIANPEGHAVAMRKVKDRLRLSVYTTLVWAIDELGLTEDFHCITSPLEITYKPTGQKIYFSGADDASKIKSIKPPFGYIMILWLEELDQFHGEAEVRKIEQSVIRGGDTVYVFKTWNPPRTSANWVNKYVQIHKPKQYKHKSTYLTVPVEWLGQPFIDNAEHLKTVNLAAYQHEYLGEVNGVGDIVFENTQIRKITDKEIEQFDNQLHGLDFGYFPHPAHYANVHYDSDKMILYIFGEVRKWKSSNQKMYNAMIEYGYKNELLICDSEDPKSIADFRAYGAQARGAEKGAGSVEYSIKWLQSLVAIVIDNERAPYTAEEFLDYAYERNKDDEILESYPREKDDAIAAVRYSTNLIWRVKGK
jgi:phage terminase large subunit